MLWIQFHVQKGQCCMCFLMFFYFWGAIISLSLFCWRFPSTDAVTLPHENRDKYFSTGINISLFQWDVRKGYVEGRRIRLHVSPTCIMSAEMRGEQGPGLLHVGDGGRKGVVRVWCLWPAEGFRFFFYVNTTFLFMLFMCGASLWTYLLWWGTPAIQRCNNPARLPLFLGADTHRSAYTTLKVQGGLCLAGHKWFVNVNPILTFTCAQDLGYKNSSELSRGALAST